MQQISQPARRRRSRDVSRSPSVADAIVGALENLTDRLQHAARFVLNRREGVSLLSMREQVGQAGVQPGR